MSAAHGVTRVALVLASSTGGIGRHLRSLTAGLVAAGFGVTVHGPAATDTLFDFTATGAGFVPIEIPANPNPGDVRAISALRRALAAGPPDLIHAHGMRAGLVAATARTAATPLVVTWHNAVLARGAKARAYRLIERYVAGAATVNLAASSDLVDRVRSLGGRDTRLAAVAAPVLPPPARDPAAVRGEIGVRPGEPLVLSVGRLHPQKRYDLLIDAAARWRALLPAPVVAIAGSGPAYLGLANRASAAHAPVILLGHRDDVADLLAAADVAVVSSDWEARQLFAQEAMSAGLPLVATRVGGLPELVGDAAVLIPPGDVDALVAAVGTLLADPDARAGLGERARRRAATWPTERDTVNQVVAVYRQLAGDAVAGRAAGP